MKFELGKWYVHLVVGKKPYWVRFEYGIFYLVIHAFKEPPKGLKARVIYSKGTSTME